MVADPKAKEKLGISGLRKAAVLIVSLEQEMATKVLAQMDKDTIERLSFEIAKLEDVTTVERDRVLEEFYHLSLAQQYIEQGGVAYARALLEKVLPPEEAQRIIETIEQSLRVAPFGFLHKAETENLLTFLQEEHPQTIALILAHLGPGQSAEVLAGLPSKKQLEVVKRLATMEHTSPEVIAQVEGALEKRFASLVTEELRETGGVEAVAEILNLTDRATERGILEALEEEDPDLVDQIRRLMFVFEDILLVNDRGVQNILKEVENDQLALALKTASEELKEKFFRNMSKRAAELIREEMEFMGPVRLADVESAQATIVDAVRKLEEAGEVIIQGRGGEEEIVV
ncbi:MAG: flagellar motor switch protein FliG [Planctomycetes bacterium]|nr:flagellar motor switch protein FliG [Planctomycetota bacterium]